jgi:dTDP-4-amino-4,6-dideoxygalactose transaminase
LQPVQAVVGSRVLDAVDQIADTRIQHARRLDEGLADLGELVRTPRRPADYREVYQLYIARVARRDELLAFLNERGIEAKVHYPIPLHLQRAAKDLGYPAGSFPVCERQARAIITLPAHQHLTTEQIDYVIDQVHAFYGVSRERRKMA